MGEGVLRGYEGQGKQLNITLFVKLPQTKSIIPASVPKWTE